MNVVLLVSAMALCGFGWAMIAYDGYARSRGLPAGKLYSASFSWLQGIAYLAMLCGLVFGFSATGWWGPIVVLVGGNIVARVFLMLAKQYIQLIAPVAILVFAGACTIVWLGQ